MELKTTLWKHQIPMHDNMLRSLKELGYAWLLAGCRTGKTLVSIALAASLDVKTVLIITTGAAMRDTWPQELEKHIAGRYEALVLSKGTSKDKARDMLKFVNGAAGTGRVHFVIVNYETAMLMDEAIAKAGFDFVVADESQKLKSHNSQTSQKLARACAHIQYRMAMTGTPWDDRLDDTYGQVRFLSPILKGKKTVHSEIFNTFGSFMFQYCKTYMMGNVEIINGYKNQDKLAAKIRPFLHHVRTEDVLDLPPVRYEVRHVPMEGDLKRMYEELDREMITTFGRDYLVGDNRLVCELRLHQLTGGFVTPMRIDEAGRYVKAAAVPTAVPDRSGDAKLRALLELVDEFGGEPFVVFVRFTADVQKIRAALEERNLKVMELSGARKENAVWEAGEGDVLIANIAAGNAGIRLTRARYVIDYTIGNSLTDYVQSRYRFLAQGLDTSKPVTYHFLMMENSVDGQIYERMQKKINSRDGLLDLVLNGEPELAID
jgi:SNF2 family DNA or RNA helicase